MKNHGEVPIGHRILTTTKITFQKYAKKISQTILYCAYVLVFVLVVIEFSFRYQIIDFYRAELNAVNPPEALANDGEKKTILVCGDSFTVQAQNWVDQMRSSLPEYNIINSAVTGSSVVETSYIAPARIKTFKPDVFVYQIYVGNDLLGINHQLNWKKWSWPRNIYWWLSDKIHVLAYFNYKSGQWKWNLGGAQKSEAISAALLGDKFDVNAYRQREKIYAQGDPFLISNSAVLENGRAGDMEYLLSAFDEIVSSVDSTCQVYIVVIPHKSQLNKSYLKNMIDVGFAFEERFKTGGNKYPFIESIERHYDRNSNVKIIDVLPPLVEKDSGSQKMYYLNDEHLTIEGQAVVKDAVLNSFGER